MFSSVRERKKSDQYKVSAVSSPLCLFSSSSLYLSGLWRQKTFAWLSPEAVTARVASLKDTERERQAEVEGGELQNAQSMMGNNQLSQYSILYYILYKSIN